MNRKEGLATGVHGDLERGGRDVERGDWDGVRVTDLITEVTRPGAKFARVNGGQVLDGGPNRIVRVDRWGRGQVAKVARCGAGMRHGEESRWVYRVRW